MGLNELIDSATSRGRKTLPMTAGVARTLTPEDLLELSLGGSSVPTPTIKELHASHHKLARACAAGTKPAEASAVTGYSTARIRQLLDDPQFQELVTYYEGLVEKDFVDLRTQINERLALLSLDSLEAAHRRLLDQPDSFAVKDLALIAELGLDRIGHGKTSTQNVEVTHSLDEEQLARLRAAQDRPAEVSEDNRAALVSLALRATAGHTDAEAAEGVEGPGGGLREEGHQGTSEAARTTIHVPSVGGVA